MYFAGYSVVYEFPLTSVGEVFSRHQLSIIIYSLIQHVSFQQYIMHSNVAAMVLNTGNGNIVYLQWQSEDAPKLKNRVLCYLECSGRPNALSDSFIQH